MIGRLRWSNQNSLPRGDCPHGPDAAMCIANTRASPTRDTTYPSLAPKTLPMISEMLATMGWIREKRMIMRRVPIRHQVFARSASRFSIFQKTGYRLPRNDVVGACKICQKRNPCTSLPRICALQVTTLSPPYLALDHEDYACLPHWRFVLSQYMYYNCCCCCCISAAH